MIMNITFHRSLMSLVAAVLVAWLSAGAMAQSLKATDADELQRLVDQARAQGAKVVVIEAPAIATTEVAAADAALSARIEDRAMEARARFREIAREASMFPERAGVAIRGYDANLSSAWLIMDSGLNDHISWCWLWSDNPHKPMGA